MKSIHRNQIHSNGQQPKRPFGFFKKERKKTDKDVSGAVLDLTSGQRAKAAHSLYHPAAVIEPVAGILQHGGHGGGGPVRGQRGACRGEQRPLS